AEELVAKYLPTALYLIMEKLKEIHQVPDDRIKYAIHSFLQADEKLDMAKALIWVASACNQPDLNTMVDEIFFRAYKKIPNVGAVQKLLGNACIYSTQQLPTEKALTTLMKWERKISYPSVKKLIRKQMERLAEADGQSLADFLDNLIPAFPLTADGVVGEDLDGYRARLHEGKGRLSIKWLTPQNKIQKGVPQAVKKAFPDELKAIKQTVKDMEEYFKSVKTSLEASYLKLTAWTPEQWKARFVDAPLTALLGKKLIWRGKMGDTYFHGMWNEDHFYNYQDIKAPLEALEEITLWHPVYSVQEEVLFWREELIHREVTQPFKQAFRELYLLTDAEQTTRTYSNRFAAHILRQHVFHALCQQRDWKYTLQGSWDSHNTPVKQIPDHELEVSFAVDADYDGETFASGIYTCVLTDRVEFHKNREFGAIPLEEIDPLVLSEVMRDVDLFVGVCSIGSDPNWQNRGEVRHRNYWNDTAFGDLGQSANERKDLLKRILPMLKIRKQVSIEGRFLVVRGHMRSYKIHLGSGNILMSPNDQYLCIVPAQKSDTGNIFLPFEGDRMLSIILSKALMLAEDRKIKDPTITRQILER
ncbi:MAG: DUF4132 domain-containing protein, partial [Bacteroidota bacterium]